MIRSVRLGWGTQGPDAQDPKGFLCRLDLVGAYIRAVKFNPVSVPKCGKFCFRVTPKIPAQAETGASRAEVRAKDKRKVTQDKVTQQIGSGLQTVDLVALQNLWHGRKLWRERGGGIITLHSIPRNILSDRHPQERCHFLLFVANRKCIGGRKRPGT